MSRARRFAALLGLLLLAAACARPQPPRPQPAPPPPPPPPPAPSPPPPPVFSATQAWARQGGLALRADTPSSAPATAVALVPHAFMRLEILQADTPHVTRLQVRCATCPGRPVGWVLKGEVVYESPPPLEQARRQELADFVLALRDAAIRRDIPALRQVMARDFVHSFEAGEGVLEAVHAWERHRGNDLVFLPALLDRGIVPVPSTSVWAAPPEFVSQPGYRELRAGFRRGPEGWEWLFLVRAGM
jgi:hypothetical protein